MRALFLLISFCAIVLVFFVDIKVDALPTYCNINSSVTKCCSGSFTSCSFPEEDMNMYCGGTKVPAYQPCAY